jgi:CheY-like chemotaxis protein
MSLRSSPADTVEFFRYEDDKKFSMRILIVEDEKKVASFIGKGLQEEGYAVDMLHDGESGAMQAVDVDYDLVVLDLMLPKLSGLEVLRIIRQQKAKNAGADTHRERRDRRPGPRSQRRSRRLSG